MAWVEKDLKDHLVSTFLPRAVSPTTPNQAAQSHIQPGSTVCIVGSYVMGRNLNLSYFQMKSLKSISSVL